MQELQVITAEAELSRQYSKTPLSLFKTYTVTMQRVQNIAVHMYNAGIEQGSLVNVIYALNLQSKSSPDE